MLAIIFLKSAGIAIGTALGVGLGLEIRKRRGNTEGLIGGSVIMTTFVLAMIVLVLGMIVRVAAL